MGDVSFKNRNLLILVFEILVIVVAIGGLTFATSKLIGGSSTIITFGKYNVDYVGDTDIVVSDLEPISDSLINYNTMDNVIRVEFSFKGVESYNDKELIYDIMLRDMDIDCSLLNEYTKWNLYKNGSLLYTGNFSPLFDGSVLTDNYKLTETQQDLAKYSDNYDKYVLIIWISEACDDLATCERIDQSGIVNSMMNMKVFIALSGGEKVVYQRIPNMDVTCVNKPELYEGMIPVYYDKGNWKVASETNSDENKLWYNYGESRWANAVMVSTDKYNDSMTGTVVSLDDILGYYVWIPRFKYKLWNDGNNTIDSYNAYKKGIDIVFESGTNNSGTVKCVDGRCLARVGEYLTHPSFGENVRGFWISKYEISKDNKFISNVEALRNNSLDEYKNVISNLNITYGIENTVDSHVVTNLEWGATLYLSHSKYGVCAGGVCEKIGVNQSYVSETNKMDTTTRNVYGVYDMAGASAEYVVGNTGFGSAMDEVKISENETWYNGIYMNSYKDYTIRGGVDKGMFFTSDIGMFDVSTRSVLIKK